MEEIKLVLEVRVVTNQQTGDGGGSGLELRVEGCLCGCTLDEMTQENSQSIPD